ncbi:kelch domain-containing protein 4-like [Mizuhopecten yessoensis]|uniref:Kelch domain-containing protein 4 n=1 Tax=Mizuhopecten yessoensis TaxID=6573 RepID=A0A210PNC6_MIZYE|nr:kelch domain-containing protein 4-like [Mizuhopecten yessoensis]OWF37988.1 Kelch domain-containing protein 4 [Mizuhopecten yessoensis]
MGKKNKKDKKGKGKEKTALKTEKNADKRAKKELAEKGEDDIERLIAEFQTQDKKRVQVVEEKCNPPSPRCNMTLTAHPTKEELIMFGGEYCTGNKTYMYNDLFFYNIKKKEWTKVTAPNAPTPRSSHQALALKQGGGQLWIFGGEFASPTQSQFYHYKELWVYHIKDKAWEKISSPGAPTSRSGHRMVHCKKHIIVFGGFHDNVRDYKYYNDVYAFDLETYSWTKLEPSGAPPAPRSGCVMAAIPDQTKVIIYGGYSKEKLKRDADKGTVHTDMVVLTTEGKVKDENAPLKWKWVHMKQSGTKPSPRCGMSLAVTPGNRAVCFGGVYDQVEDEEDMDSLFFNEMYTLDLERGKWFPLTLRGNKSTNTEKRKRRKKKNEGQGDGIDEEDDDDDEEEEEEEEEEEDMEDEDVEEAEDDIKKLKLDHETDVQSQDTNSSTCDLGNVQESSQGSSQELGQGGEEDIFKVTMGAKSAGQAEDIGEGDMDVEVFIPPSRMGALMTVRGGELFLYGGLCEVGDRQITFSDFYSLDLHKLDEWTVLIQNKQTLDWDESDSDDETKGASGGKEEDDDDDDEDDDEDDSDEDIAAILEGCDVPPKSEEEDVMSYFERNKEFWEIQSQKYFKKEDLKVTKRTITKFAKELCQEYCDQ